MKRVGVAVFVVLIVPALACAAETETLTEALAQHGIDAAARGIARGDWFVVSQADPLVNDELGAFAFQLARDLEEDNWRLGRRIFYFGWLDKKTNEWRDLEHVPEYTEEEAREFSMGEQFDSGMDFGSLMGIEMTPGYFYVSTHYNPSAGASIVLDRTPKVVDVIYGGLSRILRNDIVIYGKSQPHFSDTHQDHRVLYDPATRRNRQIYPIRPYGPVMQEYIERRKKAHESLEYFQLEDYNRGPLDYDYFNAQLKEMVVDRTAGTAAFVVSVENPEEMALDPRERTLIDMFYLYRRLDLDGQIEYEEYWMADLEKRFGKLSLTGYMKRLL